jgi:hypothetical protein
MNSDPLFPALAPKAGGGPSHSVMTMFGSGSPSLVGAPVGSGGASVLLPGAPPTSYSAAVTKKNYAFDSTPSLLLEADFPSLNGAGISGGGGGTQSATLTPSMTFNGPTGTSLTSSSLGGVYYQQHQQQQRVTGKIEFLNSSLDVIFNGCPDSHCALHPHQFPESFI